MRTAYDAWAADGEPTRSRWYPGDASTTYYDTEFDERTGLATGRRKYRHGALDSSSQETYDAGGLATRSTHFNANGRRFGVTDFAAGLKVASRYDLGDDSTLEVRFAHDEDLPQRTVVAGAGRSRPVGGRGGFARSRAPPTARRAGPGVVLSASDDRRSRLSP
jgi:hypothetical protein